MDAGAILDALYKKRTELFQLKGAIAQATAGIMPLLSEMEERKAEKNFFSGLPTREGEELVSGGLGKDPIKYQWSAYINRESLDKALAKTQDDINQLQDEIDAYNAVTDVVLPEVPF